VTMVFGASTHEWVVPLSAGSPPPAGRTSREPSGDQAQRRKKEGHALVVKQVHLRGLHTPDAANEHKEREPQGIQSSVNPLC